MRARNESVSVQGCAFPGAAHSMELVNELPGIPLSFQRTTLNSLDIRHLAQPGNLLIIICNRTGLSDSNL